MPAPSKTIPRPRRAFTLLEVLLASSFTAIACTAAAMMIKSINDASSTTSGLYAAAADTRNALACIDLLVEQAPLIGFLDGEQVLLWRNDDNHDGRINLLEMTLVHYDATAHRLSLQDVRLPPNTSSAVFNAQNAPVPLAQFATSVAASRITQHANLAVRPLIDGVTQCLAWCDGANANSQIVQLNFTVTRNDGAQAFSAVMTPRSRTREPVP